MTKTLQLSVDGVEVDLVLRRATIGDEMRRGMLMATALETPQADPAEQTVAVLFYPRCLAAVSGTVNGKKVTELSIPEFISLPFEIGEAWLSAVIEQNPAWRMADLTEQELEETKKKLMMLASG